VVQSTRPHRTLMSLKGADPVAAAAVPQHGLVVEACAREEEAIIDHRAEVHVWYRARMTWAHDGPICDGVLLI